MFLIVTILLVCENISVQTFKMPYAIGATECYNKVSEFLLKHLFYIK